MANSPMEPEDDAARGNIAASLARIVLLIGMIWAMNHNINARMGNLEVQLVKIESRITGLVNSFAVFDKILSAVEIAVTK